ncbi:SDR family NAD(P)-dependent oxidoreductase [Sphingobium sp. V4]|uniref:SDR family NAD(P)-dependent oxidoreductase n=1 Tax=Sphingobium sp. V4 TaxID=3038927 RepID=UPI00255804CB|nr:SDR family NAD(P)-dependent oxidoreductase [Sphingobium sp. V4]WIW89434.1 SDR family NAD(P)-dependent oxidoreductase [Sphingobium sp. V4]
MLEGRVAIVTGAGSGIGAATAELCAAQGAVVYAVDANGHGARETAERITRAGGICHDAALDVADLAACRCLAESVKGAERKASILVNSAGVSVRAAVDDPGAEEAWHRCMDVNATGVYNMVLAFTHQMRETKGAIVNIASTAALLTTGVFAAYCASKGAVVAMTRSLAVELGPSGVRVNAIAPGLIATPMSARLRDKPEMLAPIMTRIPLGQVGEPIDIAEAAAFLASDRARWITGVVLAVDGGLLAA